MRKTDGRKLPHDKLEAIRLSAVKRLAQGESVDSIARDLGFNRSSIYAWRRIYRVQGKAGLKAKSIPGRPVAFNPPDWEKLLNLIADTSPETHGIKGSVWSYESLLNILDKKFTPTPSKASVDKMASLLGLSNRRIQQRLRQRNSAAIDQWLHETFPQLQYRARQQNARIMLCTLMHIQGSNATVLLATTPRGKAYFQVFLSPVTGQVTGQITGQVTGKQLSDFLQNLLETENRPLFILLDAVTELQEIFHQIHGDWLVSARSVILVWLPSSEQVQQAQNKTLLAHAEQPDFANLEAWILLLNRSLMNFQYPLSDFLFALGNAVGGLAHIAPNLKLPSPFLRRPPDQLKMSLDTLITVDKTILQCWHDNPFLKVFSQAGDIYALDDILTKKERAANEFCRQIFNPTVGPMLGMCFNGPENTQCGLFLSRSHNNARPFELEIHDFLHRLRPHLENAANLAIHQWRTTFTLEALEEATDNLEIAVLVLDGQGRLIGCSGIAEEIMKKDQFITLLQEQQIQFRHTTYQKKFRQAVAQAIAWRQAPIGTKPIAAMQFSFGAEHSLGVIVQPITPPSLTVPHSTVVSPHVIVYISEPAKPRPSVEHRLIANLFNLSSREAHLTTQICDGLSLQEIGQAMGITQSTARTYLQHIYEKVGVNRRQDLVQRVMKSVAPLV